MKWLQDNPLGIALAGSSGVLFILAAVMAILWSLPAAVDQAGVTTEENAGNGAEVLAHTMAALSEFQVINERPVFNESRQPVIDPLDDEELVENAADAGADAVTEAPDVRLTGVIITPSMRIVSLTPADSSVETLMAHQGQPLTGDFAGWLVSSVNPRNVVLESRDGQKLELGLQVYDVTIKQPPKPEPVATTQPNPDGQAQGAGGEPLSRAEQIRQRIAERREELRREQEAQKAAKPSYQSAIRALMKTKPKDTAKNDKNDG